MTIDHSPILGTRTLYWPDESACARDAAALARQTGLRDAFIELQGALGAGKTTFVRHLLRALGVAGQIKSPTYAVLETYRVADFDISHFDFYRFSDPRECAHAGFRDIFAEPGLKLVEWAEKAAGQLPTPDLSLQIEIGDTEGEHRRVLAQALTSRGLELLA
jgi:tRNA threonylcarbamoyladenosine biosynthesis protein TsaE